MHSFLQSQLLSYQIFVIEQYSNDTFNRAKLMNIGYIEARKRHKFDCYVFHDVDMLPLDSYILYNCSVNGPIHMASAIDKWNYKYITDLQYYQIMVAFCTVVECLTVVISAASALLLRSK